VQKACYSSRGEGISLRSDALQTGPMMNDNYSNASQEGKERHEYLSSLAERERTAWLARANLAVFAFLSIAHFRNRFAPFSHHTRDFCIHIFVIFIFTNQFFANQQAQFNLETKSIPSLLNCIRCIALYTV